MDPKYRRLFTKARQHLTSVQPRSDECGGHWSAGPFKYIMYAGLSCITVLAWKEYVKQ